MAKILRSAMCNLFFIFGSYLQVRPKANKTDYTSWHLLRFAFTRENLLGSKHFVIRQVEGDSMLPTLQSGQLIVGRQTKTLKPGDVVIVSHAGLEKIKRIEKQQRDLIYLLGDNPSASTDSRDFGWLPAKFILAKVVWPKL